MKEEQKKRVITLVMCLVKMAMIPWGMMFLWNRIAWDFNAPQYGYGMFFLAYLLYIFGAGSIKNKK